MENGIRTICVYGVKYVDKVLFASQNALIKVNKITKYTFIAFSLLIASLLVY